MISIIIPIYNPGERLGILLDCVKKQSVKDFEVLMIDDGSTDSSREICDNYAKLDKRFCAFHQPNSGVSAARNRGLQEANGEYVTFLDADDEILPDYLEVLCNTQMETEADIVCCDVACFKNGKETSRFTDSPQVLKQKDAMNLLLSRRGINSGPCAKLFRSSILRQLSFPPLKVYEDILFVRDAFSKANSIALTNRTEYRYIQNTDSAMHKTSLSPSLDIITATRELCEYICDKPELAPSCLYITLSHMMQYAIPLLRSEREDDKLFVSESKRTLRKYQYHILTNSAFPWKEKILFMMYAHNIKK